MISVKLKGPWKQFRSLIGGYDRRLKYVSRRIGRDLAVAFLAKIKESAPPGEEYRKYIDSLAVVELTDTKGRAVFTVISDRSRVKLGDAFAGGLANKTIVYIYGSQGEAVSDVVELLEAGNPWPADMVPHGVPKNDVTLIHRTVSDGEIKWARQHAMDVVRTQRETFRRYGVHWGKALNQEEHADELASLPDFMSMAIRAEFGINADPHPHWRPAAKWVLANAVEILKRDDKIHSALHDSLFREHTLHKGSEFKTMTVKEFKKEAGAFEKKVVGM